MKTRTHFKVYTNWVSDNAFFIQVEEYIVTKRFLRKDKHEYITTYQYWSWETFMRTMWKNHLIRNKLTTWEIDSRI